MSDLSQAASNTSRKLLVADVPIESASADELGHQDVATLLAHVLIDWLPEPQPLHVALYGPWGAGKSGIISLLKGQIAKSDQLRDSVFLLDFSLWKFGAENVRRGLLLFLDSPEGLHTQTGMAERLSKASARTEVKTSIDWSRFLMWLGLGALCVAVYLVTPAVTSDSSLAHRFFDKIINLGIVLSVALGAITSVAKLDLQTQVSEGSSTPPPDRADQFKAVFEELLDEARSRGTTDGSQPWADPKKLVLVFDDLDRVPPSLAWDVLTTVKTFMDADHCIYIVPCDRDAVVDAMRSQSGPQIEARAIDFLDKFFQVSFNLPATYPREFRQIAEEVCKLLSLPSEIAAIAVAGFYRTPRSLKIFLNQVSLLDEFIRVRNQRLGALQTQGLLLKVVKVHALRVLWPACGRAIAEMPALMTLLEQRAQGIQTQEKSEVSELAEQFLTSGSEIFARGLREFLVATLGTVVGQDAQSAIKLSEAIWAEAHGDLDSLRTYLATGDSEGVARLFEKGGVENAVGFARDAFATESQTATPDSLVGWTGTLLQAFFGEKSADPQAAIVDLTVGWASSPQVSPLLSKLPPGPLVRAIASTAAVQAATAGKRVVDLAHAELTLPLPDYTAALLHALSVNRERLLVNHPELGNQIREHLSRMVATNARTHALNRVSVLGQGVPGSEWELWWDEDLGAELIASITGAAGASEDLEIIGYATRPGHEPSSTERRSAVKTAVRLFQQSGSSLLDPPADIATTIVSRIGLAGEPVSVLETSDAGTYAEFTTRLGDPDQKLSALLLLIRLATFSDSDARSVVLERALKPAIPAFSSPQMMRLIEFLSDAELSGQEGWSSPLLERCVELRDAALFILAAEKSKNSTAIAAGVRAALRADEAFGDSVLGRVQRFCDATTFASIMEERVGSSAPDVASTGRLIGVLQSLPEKPALQNSTWHTVATKLEQGVMALSEPGQAQALRRSLGNTLLGWLPDADQRHLADFATAVITGAQEQPNDPPDTILAKVEAGLMFEPICQDKQASTLAGAAAHVLAWPNLLPTVVSQIVTGIASRPRILERVTSDAFDAIEMARDTRSDEGKAFLSSLIDVRPPKPQKNPKQKSVPKSKSGPAS